MTKERWRIVDGIRLGIELLKLKSDVPMEQAIVFYGQDDKVTLEEAKEVLGLKRKAA